MPIKWNFVHFIKKKQKMNANKLNCFYFLHYTSLWAAATQALTMLVTRVRIVTSPLTPRLVTIRPRQRTRQDYMARPANSCRTNFVWLYTNWARYAMRFLSLWCLSWSISSRVPIWRRDASSPSYCRRCSARKTRRLPSRCLSCGRLTWNGFLTWTRTFARIVCSIYATF